MAADLPDPGNSSFAKSLTFGGNSYQTQSHTSGPLGETWSGAQCGPHWRDMRPRSHRHPHDRIAPALSHTPYASSFFRRLARVLR